MAQESKHAFPSLTALILLLLALALPGVAAANSTAPTFATFGPALKTICDGDCGQQSILESRREAAGFPGAFDLGLKALEDGLDLTLESDGNIFILAPLNSSGLIRLNTTDLVILDNVLLNGTEIVLAPAPGIVPPIIQLPPICACISIGDLSRDLLVVSAPAGDSGATGTAAGSISLRAGDSIIAALVGLDTIVGPPPGIVISRSGDIYLDASMVEFSRLSVTAGKSLFIVSTGSVPVPEPGTALFLGLGLGGLASRRTRSRD